MIYINNINDIRAYFNAKNHSLDDYSDRALEEILNYYRYKKVELSLDVIYRWNIYDSLEDACRENANSDGFFDTDDFKNSTDNQKTEICKNVLESLDYCWISLVENGTKYYLVTDYIEDEEI